MYKKFIVFIFIIIFINFSRADTKPLSYNFIIPTYCGDGLCILGENCATCSSDCGVCPLGSRGKLQNNDCSDGPIKVVCKCEDQYYSSGYCFDYEYYESEFEFQKRRNLNNNKQPELIVDELKVYEPDELVNISINLSEYINYFNLSENFSQVYVMIDDNTRKYTLRKKGSHEFGFSFFNTLESGEHVYRVFIFDGIQEILVSQSVFIVKGDPDEPETKRNIQIQGDVINIENPSQLNDYTSTYMIMLVSLSLIGMVMLVLKNFREYNK